MPKKKVVAGLILLFLFLDAGIIFYFMKSHRDPAPVPLVAGQNSPSIPRESFSGIPIPEGVFCDRIVIQKNSRAMTLYRGTEAIKTYRIALGGNPVGHKEFEGDQKTPEGIYSISGRNPKSSYHLSLRISYPNEADIAHAQALEKSPGGDIMIHGQPNGYTATGEALQLTDWTAGCLAVTDSEIEEIWRVIPDGTPVEIRP
jgi:murein L,D-transpeptidase YafK